jgi:DNA-binding XRE family transcriptional regulator
MVPRKSPLTAYREANGDLTQAQAAARVGITQSAWSRIENGKCGARPKVAKKIARLTGVALESLLNFGDNGSGVRARRRDLGSREITSNMP